jgi:hypothetical protein
MREIEETAVEARGARLGRQYWWSWSPALS